MRRTPMLPRRTALRANPANTRAWLDRSRKRTNPIPSTVRKALAVRSGGVCEFPGCEWPAVHAHHRLRQSQGGKHTLANLLHLCGRHHALIHDNPSWAYERGFLVRSTGPEAA